MKMSFGSEAPRFGRIVGGAPLVRSIDSATHATQGSSGSSRLALKKQIPQQVSENLRS
jgi:hypothetical protein